MPKKIKIRRPELCFICQEREPSVIGAEDLKLCTTCSKIVERENDVMNSVRREIVKSRVLVYALGLSPLPRKIKFKPIK